ncbi:SurA N-terminal domain-containing protein [Ornithinibacillus halophilus]|uniref:SurA N-terminal domain-containing protein n=1 Tax=Ornithinibacillus halophilus TaxID=930117 RepID=A0A1M5H127_9BACI|nr:SurA N-terminal domain-containing protein [Ornithinibacillus halophilus]SHG09625.1 SurA N-terminal domain-containing protein [Ornithinibacillus halophilus]
MKKLFLLLIAFSLASVVTACGDDDNNESNNDGNTTEQSFEVTDEEIVDEEEVVLSVNDKDIFGNKYNPVYYQTKQRLYQAGQDISDLELVKEQTFNELIAQELIRQDAIESGLEVTDEEVENRLENVKSEDEEGYEAYLKQFDLTEDAFKEQLKFNLLVDKYMTDVITVEEVPEEEIKELYEQLKEQNEDIMEYDEAKVFIEQQLTQQKQSEQLLTKIEELEESADIEKML